MAFQKDSTSVSEPIYVHRHTHNASLGVPLAAVAERGCQGGGAALVVQGGASIVDG